MNRRDFSRFSALALAGSTLPSFAQGASSDKPDWLCSHWLGTISGMFMRACQESQKAKITALVTGHADTKGKKFAAMYGIPETSIYSYEQFDRIKDNKAVDAVYVGLPNSMHCEYTVRAAKAGKNVLCEKPMAISSAECRQMIDACKAANVKLMIAYRCQYDPTYLEAERIVQSGELGNIQAVEGAFGFNFASPDFWRLKKKLAGGGSLMDVGIYPLNTARFLLKEDPTEFTAMVSTRDKTSGRFAEMEQTVTWTMKFPSGIMGTGASTYGGTMPGFLRINGDKASIELSNAFGYTGSHLISLSKAVTVDMTSSTDDVSVFRLEADHMADCIRTNTQPKSAGEEGLKDLIAMEAIYKAAGTPMS